MCFQVLFRILFFQAESLPFTFLWTGLLVNQRVFTRRSLHLHSQAQQFCQVDYSWCALFPLCVLEYMIALPSTYTVHGQLQ